MTKTGRELSAHAFRWCARICVGLALVLIALALMRPTELEHAMNWGLASLIAAFLFSFWRLYLLRAPFQGKWGLITFEAQPLAYRIALGAGTAMAVFLLYVVLGRTI